MPTSLPPCWTNCALAVGSRFALTTSANTTQRTGSRKFQVPDMPMIMSERDSQHNRASPPLPRDRRFGAPRLPGSPGQYRNDLHPDCGFSGYESPVPNASQHDQAQEMEHSSLAIVHKFVYS